MDLLQSSYDHKELQRARGLLSQEMDYGPLKYLNKKYSFSAGCRMFPNIWEGYDGMMGHVSDHFPMPQRTSNFQEQLNTEPYDRSSPDWLPHGNTSIEPCQVASLNFTNTSASCDLSGTLTDTLSCDNSKDRNNLASWKSLGTNKQELLFWVGTSIICDRLDNLGNKLSRAKAKLLTVNTKARKEACHQIANLYKTLKNVRDRLVKKERQFKKHGYKNIIETMPVLERSKFKQRYGIKGNLPNRLTCAFSRLENLKTLLRGILCEHVDTIEPHKGILREVIKDLEQPEFGEGDHCLFSTKSGRTSDFEVGRNNRVLKEEDLYSNEDEFDETSVGSDIVNTFTDDQNLFSTLTQSGHTANTLSQLTELDKAEKLIHRKWINTGERGDWVESSQSEAHEHDMSLFDNQRSDSKINCSGFSEEDMFWNNLSKLRREIVDALFKIHEISKMSSKTPTQKSQQGVRKTKCQQLLSVHTKICLFIADFNRLREETKTQHYKERGPFGLSDLQRQNIHIYKADCGSLDVVEALLNNLKSAYIRVRGDKSKLLQSFGLISDPNDLIIATEENKVKLVRVCAHSECNINVTVMSDSENSLASMSELSRDLRQASSSSTIDTDHVHTQAPVSCSEASNDTFKSNWRALSENPSQGGDASKGDLWANKSTHDPSGGTGDFRGSIMQTRNLPESTLSNRPEFLEKERQHWDRLQILFKKVCRCNKDVHSKSKQFWLGKEDSQKKMDALYLKITELSRMVTELKSESYQAGYCKMVAYRNVEFLSQNCARLLVRNLNGVETKLDTLFESFKRAVKKLRLSHLYS